MQLLESLTVKLTKPWTPKMCLESLLCYRYSITNQFGEIFNNRNMTLHQWRNKFVLFQKVLIKINSLFQLYKTLDTAVTAIAVIDNGYLNTSK